MNPASLPFEFPFQWDNESLREGAGVTPEGAAILKQRDRDLEDYLSLTKPPLIFNWSGAVVDLLNMRAGPDWFRDNGSISHIEYHFDTPASVTVEWRLDNTVVATHSPSADSVVTLDQAYAGQDVVAVVTAAAGAAAGLTARVFQG